MNTSGFRLESNLPAFLVSEVALDDLLHAWENGTLPKKAWTHEAHVAVAACYAFEMKLEQMFPRMKAGIIRYNEAVGTANTDSGGYHETLTRFWAGEICKLVRPDRYSSRLEAVRRAMERFGSDRDLFRHYYSFDVANDPRARKEWVGPDRLDSLNT